MAEYFNPYVDAAFGVLILSGVLANIFYGQYLPAFTYTIGVALGYSIHIGSRMMTYDPNVTKTVDKMASTVDKVADSVENVENTVAETEKKVEETEKKVEETEKKVEETGKSVEAVESAVNSK